jgi:hypothetical protein
MTSSLSLLVGLFGANGAPATSTLTSTPPPSPSLNAALARAQAVGTATGPRRPPTTAAPASSTPRTAIPRKNLLADAPLLDTKRIAGMYAAAGAAGARARGEATSTR